MIGVAVDFWVRLLLGHLAGDYIFQSAKMALKKSSSYRVCAAHCAAYTATMAAWLSYELAFSTVPALIFLAIVFCSHFVLDKTHVVQWMLDKTGARTFKSAGAYREKSQEHEIYKQFYVAFTAIVHAVADNTMHFILLYLGLLAINAVPW